MSVKFKLFCAALVLVSIATVTLAESKKKKSVVDMTEAEIETIYDQWEVNNSFMV